MYVILLPYFWRVSWNGTTFVNKRSMMISVSTSPFMCNGPLTRYEILRAAHTPGMPGTSSRHRLQRKPLVSDPGMHHGTCVTHVPWCMLGSLTRGGGENVPGIPGAYATHNFTYLARGPLSNITRLLHSPGLVVVGLPAVYDTRLSVGWHRPFCDWLV